MAKHESDVRESAATGAWLAYNATVFIASACVMTVEILSTRLAALYLGSSLYTWTSAIGVVLAGISIGNYVGGRVADRFHPRRTLALVFVASAIACSTIPTLNAILGKLPMLDGLAWPTRIFLHFFLAFSVPAILLGMISPVVAKSALGLGMQTGRTIGTIYAWGAVGSIVGTFAAGFLLVATVGTERSVLLVSLVLALVGIGYGYRSWLPYAASGYSGLLLVCAIAPWGWAQAVAAPLRLRFEGPDIIYVHDSQYQRVVVRELGPTERMMVLDSLVHSQVDLADPLDLKYGYEAIYAGVLDAINPDHEPVDTLVIGGGGLVFPRYIEVLCPGSRVEVAEIDPLVTEAAFETFGIPSDTTIVVHDLDARNFIADLMRLEQQGDPQARGYDLILGDAFSDFSVPFHLTTLEFTQQLDHLLSADGVYVLNMIDSYDSGAFLGSVLETCRAVFPHVGAIAAQPLAAKRNTFVVVGSKQPIDLAAVAENVRERTGRAVVFLGPTEIERLAVRNDGLLLTDDFAPVENMLAAVVRNVTGQSDDGAAIAARVDLAALLDAGDYAAVVEACRIRLSDEPNDAVTHFWLGCALEGQNRLDDAAIAFRAATLIDPANAAAFERLGAVSDRRGDFRGAVTAYRAAVKLDSQAFTARVGLARALARTGRAGEGEGLLHALIDREPEFVPARIELATLLIDRGAIAPALVQLKAAEAIDGNIAALHNQFARAYVGTDRAAAAASLARAVELAPDEPGYRANLAGLYEQLDRDADAVAEYQACLAMGFEHPQVLTGIVWLLAASPQLGVRDGAAAVVLAEKLQAAAPNSPNALDAVAAAYAEAGRFDEAIAVVNRAAEAARTLGQVDLLTAIGERRALYMAGQAYVRP